MSDENLRRLLGAAAAGDQHAWDELVDGFDHMLRRIGQAYRLQDPDAADVAQATWLKLYEHVDDLKDPSRVGGWLATTARRECLRVLRDGNRHDLFPHDETPERECGDPRPEELVLARERAEAVRRSLARLAPRDQTLLRLVVSGPRPDYHAVAAALSMPMGSIGPTRARALARLRAELEDDDTRAAIAA